MNFIKTILSLTIIFCLTTTVSGQEMTLEILKDKYFQAIGGKQKIDSVQHFIITYDYKMALLEDTISQKVYVSQPNKVRIESMIMGKTRLNVTNGEVEWTFNPFSQKEGTQKKRPLRGKELYRINYFLHAFDYLIENPTYVGIDTVNGVACHKVNYYISKNYQGTYYFDVNSYLLILDEMPVTVGPFANLKNSQFESNTREIYYSEYEYFSGICLPTKITVVVEQVLNERKIKHWEKVEDLPATLFE